MTSGSMTVSDARNERAKCCGRPYDKRTKLIIGGLVLLVIVSALSGYFVGKSDYDRRNRVVPDPLEPPGPSPSRLHVFQKAAVCTDSPECSKVGRDVLGRNGSAVDAAIASMFCNGLFNQMSMGPGGGFFMVVYIKEEGRAYVVNARETAPAAATQDMFQGNSDKSKKGPLSMGVPGEIRGLWEAHKRWGKLPWVDLVTPALEYCSEGFPMSIPLYDGVGFAPAIKNDPQLNKVYFNPTTGKAYKPGTIIKPAPNLCSTLSRIARKGGNELYNGSLANDFLEDLQKIGSIITAEDLRNYQPKISEPLAVQLLDGDTLYSPPPPSSGLVLADILNILKTYNFSRNSIETPDDQILTYHRILEAFKFGFALRTKIGDEDFLSLGTIIKNATTSSEGEKIRSRINDDLTSNNTQTYGTDMANTDDAGTAHISIIAANGDAVSVTSSINYYFGGGIATLSTGIVMNNVMDDFSSPGITNYFGLRPSPANYIEPGKRPLSSMSPSIIVDGAGNAKMVIGASGGTKITSAIALVIMRKLWLDQTIKEAVDAPRFHHQTYPKYVEYEFGITEDVLNGLRKKGHGLKRYRGRGSVVCALYRNRTGIYANSDFRKGGDVAGIN